MMRITLALGVLVSLLTMDVRPVAEQRFVRIDDMLIDVEMLVDAETGLRTAHPLNPFFLLNAWDFGVMPVAFQSDISQAERDRFMRLCARWGTEAPFICVPRTTQSGYLEVTRGSESDCFSSVGQGGRLQRRNLNLDPPCWSDRTIGHEIGHAVGLWHEQQRPDRDDYLTVETDNVEDGKISNFNKVMTGIALGPYDFLSIMHYRFNTFAKDSSKPTLVPHAAYQQYATTMGTSTEPTELDQEWAARIYFTLFRPSTITRPTESVRTQFDRGELLSAMERLHAFYMSPLGLQRPQGLSIGGRPDFLGIAAWLFDIYLGARSGGFSAQGAFDIVVASITQSEEWRQKHAGLAPLPPSSYQAYIAFDRNEFLQTLQRLDQFYASAEGLQRPDGLSIAGGPDFLGIAAWIFDIYLNGRLQGASPNAAWVQVVNAIQATDEWRRKH